MEKLKFREVNTLSLAHTPRKWYYWDKNPDSLIAQLVFISHCDDTDRVFGSAYGWLERRLKKEVEENCEEIGLSC